MEDIVPSLLDTMQNEYQELLTSSKKIETLAKKLNDKNVKLTDAQKYAQEIGTILQKIFSNNVREEILPDGRMYYNIAKRLLEPILKGSYNDISNYCVDTQKIVNQVNGIGLKAVENGYNSDRVNGIIDYVSDNEQYSKVQKSFEDSLMNYSQSVYDDFIQKNAEFKYQSGMSPKVIRVAVGKACKWCREVEGEYSYPNVPQDVWRRHENCYCTVSYIDRKHSVQDVWSKRFITSQEDIRKRATFSEEYSQNYRSATRSNIQKTFKPINKNEFSAHKLQEYDNVFVDDDISIKRKDVQQTIKYTNEAIKKYDIRTLNEPNIVFISQNKLGHSGGSYDAINNVVYYTSDINTKEVLQGFAKGNTEYHEMWHMKQADNFVMKLQTSITEENYIDYFFYTNEKALNFLDKIGVNANNVSDISEYAFERFEKKRFDEVEAEYWSNHYKGKEKK